MTKERRSQGLRSSGSSCEVEYSVLRVQGGSTWRESGEDDEEDTPVPIPNTAVKLLDAEDS